MIEGSAESPITLDDDDDEDMRPNYISLSDSDEEVVTVKDEPIDIIPDVSYEKVFTNLTLHTTVMFFPRLLCFSYHPLLILVLHWLLQSYSNKR